MFTLLNDPLYGGIELPKGLIQTLLRHPFVQRLRRISQLGLSGYVYPGASHHRLAHALGALHLMQKALASLEKRGQSLSQAEREGACAAIFLHDLGHAPFSHSLEGILLNTHHENLSIALMQALNAELGGALDEALAIFQGQHPLPFLHQLVSGQLDLDRMDYLSRDSFYTGVNEGIIGYNRLLQLFRVHEGRLAIDEKGLYAVEKFLVARRLMYWQVYLHKTGIVASEMLKQAILRARALLQGGEKLDCSPALHFFLSQHLGQAELAGPQASAILGHFVQLDDVDIWAALKTWQYHNDLILSDLSRRLLERRLFRIRLQTQAFEPALLAEKRQKAQAKYGLSEGDLRHWINGGQERNKAYALGEHEIQILLKDGRLQPISAWAEHHLPPHEVVKHFVYWPKELDED